MSTAKASIALAAEVGVVALVATLTVGERPLAHIHAVAIEATLWAGCAFLALVVLAAILAVRPRLRSRAIADEAKENFVFFGHARLWSPEDLEKTIRSADLLPQLSRQIVAMGEIAWRKHRLLEGSLTSLVIALVLISVAAVLNA